MSKKQIWLPWYRQADYDGDLSEKEKRALDSFRSSNDHPSSISGDLPFDVVEYVSELQFELYDQKQDSAALKAFAFTIAAALISYLAFSNQVFNELLAFTLSGIIIVAAWLRYRQEWHRNAEKFLSKLPDAPNSIDEGFRKVWELDFIVRQRRNKDKFDEMF